MRHTHNTTVIPASCRRRASGTKARTHASPLQVLRSRILERGRQATHSPPTKGPTMPTAKLETKSASPDDLAGAFDGFMRAFEAFKDGNDERLAQLEQRMSADVVTTDKVDRINRALDEHKRVVDELALKSARPHLGGPAARSGAALQHKAAFDGYVRKGDAGSLRDLEAKALSVGSDPDGGYLVPDELEPSTSSTAPPSSARSRPPRPPPPTPPPSRPPTSAPPSPPSTCASISSVPSSAAAPRSRDAVQRASARRRGDPATVSCGGARLRGHDAGGCRRRLVRSCDGEVA